jgi:DNA-binding MarR family transcriptional regulator
LLHSGGFLVSIIGGDPMEATEDPSSGLAGVPAEIADWWVAIQALMVGMDRIRRAWAVSAQMGVPEITTLALLQLTTPLRTQHVGTSTGLAPSSVTALIDRLERGGHVRRIRPDNNRRVVVIELTAAGRDLSDALFSPLLALLRQHEHDRDEVPELPVRVRSLQHTAQFLEHAATTVRTPH